MKFYKIKENELHDGCCCKALGEKVKKGGRGGKYGQHMQTNNTDVIYKRMET